MGILTGIFKRDIKLSDPKAWNPGLWNMIGSQSHSGVNITYEKALSNSAVFNAITLISGTIAGLPLNLYRKKPKGGNTVEDSRPLHKMLHLSPNPEMSAMSFRETMVSHILGWGNCFAEIQRDNVGRIIALWPIPPNRVNIMRMKGSGNLYYDVHVGAETIAIPRDRMLHIPGLGDNGISGYSIITLARESIGLGLAMEEFGARFFGNGTHPGAIAEHPGKLSQDAHDNLKGSLTEQYSGLGKSHRLLILEEGMQLKQIGIPPEDAQFLESRVFSVNEIARWFNLPPHKLKELTHATFTNIEHQSIEFVIDSILPWLVRFEQGYNLQLLTEVERGRKLYFKHVVEGLLRGDAESRGKFYSLMFNIGSMSINEIRTKEDMNPVEGGDEHWVMMNMMPLSRALEEPPEPEPNSFAPMEGEEPEAEEIEETDA